MGLCFFMSRSTRLVSTINRATIGPPAKRPPNGVSLLRRADSGPRLDEGWVKAQPTVVLILKRFRKRGHNFKSHPIDWEKPGIKPGPPGLQVICYRSVCLWSCSLAITSTGRVGLCFCGFMYRRRNSCLWPCSLAVPVLPGWVCDRSTLRLNWQWFWF